MSGQTDTDTRWWVHNGIWGHEVMVLSQRGKRECSRVLQCCVYGGSATTSPHTPALRTGGNLHAVSILGHALSIGIGLVLDIDLLVCRDKEHKAFHLGLDRAAICFRALHQVAGTMATVMEGVSAHARGYT